MTAGCSFVTGEFISIAFELLKLSGADTVVVGKTKSDKVISAVPRFIGEGELGIVCSVFMRDIATPLVEGDWS